MILSHKINHKINEYIYIHIISFLAHSGLPPGVAAASGADPPPWWKSAAACGEHSRAAYFFWEKAPPPRRLCRIAGERHADRCESRRPPTACCRTSSRTDVSPTIPRTPIQGHRCRILHTPPPYTCGFWSSRCSTAQYGIASSHLGSSELTQEHCISVGSSHLKRAGSAIVGSS